MQGGRGALERVEFDILNKDGAPVVTFSYLDPIDAAIVDAVLIIGAGR